MKASVLGSWRGLLLAWMLYLGGGAMYPAHASTPVPVRHVFMIVLENEPYPTTFGEHSPAPYLAL